MTIAIELVQKFTKLTKQKRELEAQLKMVTELVNDVGYQLTEQFSAEGVQSIRTDEGLVFLKRDIYASIPEDKEAAYAAFKSAGLGDMVKEGINGNTLSAWVRELETEPGEFDLPEAVMQHIRISEVYKTQMRRS